MPTAQRPTIKVLVCETGTHDKKRGKMSQKHVYEAIATLTGTIIGAGVLGIPYVMAKAGFLTGLLVLLLLGAVMVVLNLCIGEVTLRTKGLHQLTGYAGIYLGQRGKRLMTLAMMISSYGALMAYIIGEGKSLAEIFGGNPWMWSIVFFVLASLIIFKGMEAVGMSELVLSIIKFVALFTTLLLLGFSQFFDPANLMQIDLTKIFVPYGVILFAFLGAIAIPAMREELSSHLKDLKKCILIGTLIPIAAYALFGLAVVGVTGRFTTEVANLGVGLLMGFFPLAIISVFAVLSMATGFIAIGNGLKEMFWHDYKFKPINALLLTLSVPVLLILFGVHSFINILGITGAIAGGADGIIMLLTYLKARKHGQRKPEYEMKIGLAPIVLMIAVFIIGAVITIREAVL